jgi:dihydroorotase
VAAGRLSLETLVQKTSHAVAEGFGIAERGYIREGYWADLTLIDLNAPFTRQRDQVLYKCGWSPFEGTRFPASIAATLVNGQIAYENGAVNDAVRGQRLAFRPVR